MKRDTNGGLEVQALSISYFVKEREVPALRMVNLRVCKGETRGIVGESGSGKSTLAYALMGYLTPNATVKSGRVLFGEIDLLSVPQATLQRIRGARIALVPQDAYGSLNPAMRIGDQIGELLQRHTSLTRPQTCRRAIESLTLVQMPDPQGFARLFPHQLSGGMQQRVLIAMALCLEPDFLIMDEPTSNLDATTEAAILDLVRGLKSRVDAGIVYISHNLGVIAGIADRVSVMYAGELVEEGPVDEVFLRPAHPYTVALLGCLPTKGSTRRTAPPRGIPGTMPSADALPPGCIFEPRCRFRRGDCHRISPPWQAVQPGHAARCLYWPEVLVEARDSENRLAPLSEEVAPRTAEALLQAEHIRKYYPLAHGLWPWRAREMVRAVDGISLEVKPGQTVGVVGESGCGKSTFLRCIAGLTEVNAGQLIFLGEDITRPCEDRSPKVRRSLQMVFQNADGTLNPKRTIAATLARPLRLLAQVPPPDLPKRVRELLQSVQLDPGYAERFPHELSGGEKQRVAIARAFAGRPRLVLCDEPLSALDVSVQASVLELLLSLEATRGVSYLLISHDLAMIRYAADLIAVIYLGRLCEVGPAAAFWNPPHHPYTEALLSAQPVPDPRQELRRILLKGSVPSPIHPPAGCPFHTRCPRKVGAVCEEQEPPWQQGMEGHRIRCHIPINELTQVQSGTLC